MCDGHSYVDSGQLRKSLFPDHILEFNWEVSCRPSVRYLDCSYGEVADASIPKERNDLAGTAASSLAFEASSFARLLRSLRARILSQKRIVQLIYSSDVNDNRYDFFVVGDHSRSIHSARGGDYKSCFPTRQLCSDSNLTRIDHGHSECLEVFIEAQ